MDIFSKLGNKIKKLFTFKGHVLRSGGISISNNMITLRNGRTVFTCPTDTDLVAVLFIDRLIYMVPRNAESYEPEELAHEEDETEQ